MSTAEPTESLLSEGHERERRGWALIVALDSQALGDFPSRFDLAGLQSVVIGRGDGRRLDQTEATARLDLHDRRISQSHARLIREGERWLVCDDASRNGTRVNGRRVSREPIEDGDIVECGGTFLVLRRTAGGSPADGSGLEAKAEALRTLSPPLEQELSVLEKVAASKVPVLLLGESGTGKEGTARVIHAVSGRDGPFVAVNCGAIPATLVESELFGSKRGAFSGAEDRPGLIRSADGGTLFLDEVAELPLASQAALLRVLQEKEILPLGGGRTVPVNLRVVAATNQNVAALIEEGKLRRDLYARLCGYELRLPPLRERLEDLGLLLAAIIARHDPKGPMPTLTRGAAWALFAHSWPNNIRELEQAISAALAMSTTEIAVEHLPRTVREVTSTPRDAETSMRDHLLAVIEQHSGNLSAVARALKTSRSQLYRLLERNGIDPADAKKPPARD